MTNDSRKSLWHSQKRSLLRFAKRTIWRWLPNAATEFLVSDILSPKPPKITPDAQFGAPFIVVGLLSQPSGLGSAARACYQALDEASLDVYGVDVTSYFATEPAVSDFEFRDGRGLQGTGTIVLHIGGGRIRYVLSRLGADLIDQKHVLAHWFWELDTAPVEWKRALPFLHGVCASTEFVADAIRKAFGSIPVHQLPYPMYPTKHELRSRDLGDKFRVLCIFNVSSNFFRKNPLGVIHAFLLAFKDDETAELTIKYSNADAWPEAERMMVDAARSAANIRLIDQTLSPAEMDALYETANVVMSLHRSEGLGLVVVEAMMRDVPVISTDWSATSELVDDETGYPVPYELVPVEDPQGNYHGRRALWADPDIEAAASTLRHVRSHPDEATSRSQRARERLTRKLAPGRYVEAFLQLAK